MVRKIGGPPPSRPGSTTPVQPAKTVESGKVAEVQRVTGAQKQAPAGKIQRVGRTTAAQREQLYQFIDEEADKMFSPEILTPEKKETVKEAVRMAVASGLIDDDKEEGSKT